MTIAVVAFRGMEVTGHRAGSAGSLGYASILLLVCLVAVCILILWRAIRRSNRGSGGSDEGDGGGGGWRRGPIPKCPPPDGDPEWWPEFEREFAAYVNRHLARRP